MRSPRSTHGVTRPAGTEMLFAPAEVPEGYYQQLGRLTHSWAQIETMIDYCIAIAFHEFGGTEYRRRLPQVLKHKITFLRDMHMKLSRLAPHKAQGLALLDRVDSMTARRHFFTHG